MNNCVWWNGSIIVFTTGRWNHTALIKTLALSTTCAPWASVIICKTGTISVSFTVRLVYFYLKKKFYLPKTVGIAQKELIFVSTQSSAWYITEYYISDFKNGGGIIFFSYFKFSKIKCITLVARVFFHLKESKGNKYALKLDKIFQMLRRNTKKNSETEE